MQRRRSPGRAVGNQLPSLWWDRLLAVPLVAALAAAAIGPALQGTPLPLRDTALLGATVLAALLLTLLAPRHWPPVRLIAPLLALACGMALSAALPPTLPASTMVLPLLATLAPDPAAGAMLLVLALGAMLAHGWSISPALPWCMVSWAALVAGALLRQMALERAVAHAVISDFAGALSTEDAAGDDALLASVRRLTNADDIALLRADTRPQGIAAVAQPFLWLRSGRLHREVAYVAPNAAQLPNGFPLERASTLELSAAGSKLFVVGGNPDRDELLMELAKLVAMRESNRRLVAQVRDADYHALESLVKALDARDPYTRGHSERVARYAEAIGREIGLPEDLLKDLWRGGMLHDIGKIGIPERILHKPDRLTAEEYVVMQNHVKIGAEIIDAINTSSNVLDIVYSHHENYNGTGYPRRLRGEQTPLLARIAHIADSFEAMTSARSYNQPRTLPDALAELRRCSGSAFDPAIAAAFLQILLREGDALMRAHETASYEAILRH